MIGGQPRQVEDLMQKYINRQTILSGFPHREFFKCNIDVVFNIHNAKTSWACCVRDEKWEFVVAYVGSTWLCILIEEGNTD